MPNGPMGDNEATITVPDGFVLHDRRSPVTAPWEPIYARHEADQVRLGLVIRTPHTNSRGLLHGGVIAAITDNAMGLSVATVLRAARGETGTSPITASLSIDYLGRAALGQWLEIDTQFVHLGKQQAVAQALVTADGQIIARANATFRVG